MYYLLRLARRGLLNNLYYIQHKRWGYINESKQKGTLNQKWVFLRQDKKYINLNHWFIIIRHSKFLEDMENLFFLINSFSHRKAFFFI